MQITAIIDAFFVSPPAGVSDSAPMRTALTDLISNIRAMPPSVRSPVALQAYPAAFAFKMLAGSLKSVQTLSASPTDAEILALQKVLYDQAVKFMVDMSIPLPMEMNKSTLLAMEGLLIAHARAFDLLARAPSSLTAILGTGATTTSTVLAMIQTLEKCNAAPLRRACVAVRAARGVPENVAPPAKPNEVSQAGDTAGEIE